MLIQVNLFLLVHITLANSRACCKEVGRLELSGLSSGEEGGRICTLKYLGINECRGRGQPTPFSVSRLPESPTGSLALPQFSRFYLLCSVLVAPQPIKVHFSSAPNHQSPQENPITPTQRCSIQFCIYFSILLRKEM